MKACCFVAKVVSAGVFLLVPLASRRAEAADASFYGVLKSQQYFQSNSAAPAALASNGFAFNSFVFASGDHLVTNAAVKPGNSTPLRPLLSDSNQVVWRFEERFHTQAALDAVYPNGNLVFPVNYTMTLNTVNDGVKSASLSFAAAALLGTPPTPQVANFNAAQSIDTSASFTLRNCKLSGTA